MKKRINYFNEALLLATYICNTEKDNDSVLPIDYKKVSISKNEIEREYQWLVSFISIIRSEARILLEKYQGMEILFQRFDNANIPEILNFLTYTQLEQSIECYSPVELLEIIKKDFQINLSSLGYKISNTFHFEEIDQLILFNEQQRYIIYKLFNNINSTYDVLYNFLMLLEKIIKNREDLILKEIDHLYESIKDGDIMGIDAVPTMDYILKNHKIKNIEHTIFIQFNQLVGFSLSPKNAKKGFLFIGLLPYLLRNSTITVEDNRIEMASKFLVISDTTRFNIVILLSDTSMYGREIAEKLSISTGTISHHLSLLLKEGLIISETKGKRIYYRLNQLELNRMGQFIDQLGGKKNEK